MRIIVFACLFGLALRLSAQQFQEPSGTIIKPDLPETRFVIAGLGFDVSFPLLTASGSSEYDAASFHMVQAIRLHLALAFALDHVYALGFATYLMGGHQNSDANNITVGRGFLIFSPALYNQLSLGPSVILHLAVGPSLLFSFLDYKNIDGTVTTRNDTVAMNFDLGLYLAAGFQLRFGMAFGMGLEFAGNLFFTGSKGHEFANGDVLWNEQQVYLGSLGAVLSFLLFL